MDKQQLSPEQKEFLKIISGCQRRMNAAQAWRILSKASAIGACFAILFEAAAFIIPFYYADLYALLAVMISILTGLAISWMKRNDLKAAALKIDSFGFEERVITAYENITANTPAQSQFAALQQTDAIRRLHAGKEQIKIPLCPPVKNLALCCGMLLAILLLSLLPSAVKQRAEELHNIRLEAEEKLEEIEEVLEELEEFTSAELTEEQRAKLQEMINSLQSSAAEYGQAASPEALASAGQKLDYKYADMSGQLAELAKLLQSGAAVSPSVASKMQNVSQRLQSLGQGSNGQGGDGKHNGDGNGNSDGNGTNGGDGSNNGSGNGNGNGGDGDGSGGSGDGDGNGNGSGNGNGDGNGNGSGDGSGNGNGGGDGSGNGRGTGTARNERDYISIPNDIGNDPTLTGQAGASDTTEAFRAQNGLSWEGNHVPYESVISEYQDRAYEGISSGKYPRGMENVIKEYFGSFNN